MIVRERRRALLAGSAIIFGMIALVLAGGYVDWNFWHYREATIRSHLGHIQISRVGFRDSGVAYPFRFLLKDDRATIEALEQVDGVRLVAPRLAFNGLLSRGESTVSFIGEGVDPVSERELSSNLSIVAGEMLSPDAPREVILGEGLAASVGAKVGDTVILVATTRSGGINAVEVRVRGLFASVTKAFDDTALRIPIGLARELLRVPGGSHTWVLLLDDTAKTGAAAAQVRGILSAERFEVLRWNELADFYNKSAALLDKQMLVMRLIIALIIVLSISNVMTMNVLERTAEIGTAMALGVRRALVLRRFLAEGFVLGILMAAFGLLLGVAAARMISAIGIPNPPPPGMTRGYVGGILVTPGLLTGAFVLGVFTTLVASLYPALRASRLPIVDALRFNR
jgi:putative ABC transport system permease protein